MAIFNSAAYAIVLFTFTLLELLKDSLSEATKYNIIGHLIILFLTITVVTNLMVGFVSSILAFRDLGREYIWGKAKKGEKEDSNTEKKEKNTDLDDSSIKSLNQVQPSQNQNDRFKKKNRARKIKKGRLSNNLTTRTKKAPNGPKEEPKDPKTKEIVKDKIKDKEDLEGKKKVKRNRSTTKRLKEMLERRKSAPKKRKISKN